MLKREEKISVSVRIIVTFLSTVDYFNSHTKKTSSCQYKALTCNGFIQVYIAWFVCIYGLNALVKPDFPRTSFDGKWFNFLYRYIGKRLRASSKLYTCNTKEFALGNVYHLSSDFVVFSCHIYKWSNYTSFTSIPNVSRRYQLISYYH